MQQYYFDEFIVFGDMHYRRNPSKSYIREDGLSSWFVTQLNITNQIFDYAEEHGISLIIHNGDLFHAKNRINVQLYNEVWKLYRSLSDKFEIKFNTGNHDKFSKMNSSLRPFSDIVEVISAPRIIDLEHVHLRIIPNGMVDRNLELPDYCDAKNILILHEDITGLLMGPTDYKSGSPLKYQILGDWDIVINGHIHRPQNFKNIVNVGSPLIQDWGEVGEEKRFIHYKDGEIKSISIDGPRFHIFERLTEKLKSKIESNNIDFMRIDISPDQISDPIFEKHNVSYNIVKSKAREIRLKTTATIDEEIEQYVQLSQTQLNKEKLVEIGKSLNSDNYKEHDDQT